MESARAPLRPVRESIFSNSMHRVSARVPNHRNCYRFRDENKFVQNIMFLPCNNTEIFELMIAGKCWITDRELPHPRICTSAKTLRHAEASKRIHPSLLLPLCRAFAACLPSALSTLCLPTALLRLLVLCCPARPLVRLSAFLGLLDLPAWRTAVHASQRASACDRRRSSALSSRSA